MYKFAHFADVHWRGLSRHSEYKRSFEHAFSVVKENNVDAIFIAGDIVHSKTQGISPELIDSLCWWFKSMAEICKVYVTLGNHDGLVMNRDREDAISPIIRALDLDNLILIKNSEIVHHDEKVAISNFSCFDEPGWNNLSPVEGMINIAVYHGAVVGGITDIDWEIDGEIDIGVFKGYDFVFLGDIHKHQYLNKEKTIAYPGSTIQQNYGESPGKGFMLWEIEDASTYSSRHIEVKHDRPFVTIDWKGTVAETLDAADRFSDQSRFRVRTDVPLSQGEIKQLYASLKDFKSASEIVMKHEVKKSEINQSIDSTKKKINLSDPTVVSSMIKQYYSRAGLSERTNAGLEELVNKFWKTALISDRNYDNGWEIKSLEFDNTFGFGRDNYIDFEKIGGITGIFGRNRIGKSSICGTLMYVLFNTTDRGPISNLHVINTRKGHCKAKAVIQKSGKNYLIERQTIKRTARSGKVSATTQLNLFEVDEVGSIIKDLAGEQRRDTEKILREIVGNPEDFLLTSFASQGEMNSFLKQKASARKTVLSKFLELDVFERLNEAARNEHAAIKNALKSVPTHDFDISILDNRNKLASKVRERESAAAQIDNLRSKIKNLELSIATSDMADAVTSEDILEQESSISILRERKNNLSESMIKLGSEKEVMVDRADKIQSIRDSFPLEELKLAIKEQDELSHTVDKTKYKLDKEKQRLKALESEAEKLDDVPCNDECPVHKYVDGALKAKNKIKSKTRLIENIGSELKEVRKALKKLQDKSLHQKLEKYNDLVSKHSDIIVKKADIEIKISKSKSSFEKVSLELSKQELRRDEMMANVIDSDESQKINALKNKLKGYRSELAQSEENYSSFSETIGRLDSEHSRLIQEKEEYEKINEKWRIFELFQTATSKNGIPLEVIRSRLPEINGEIASILQGVTGFTVELESDEGSNEMNIFINYGDSKRIIECCSGMEKMMSAMAIRVALTNVSALPKANLLVIDEGFGALDSGNVESCSRFLQSLKKWFSIIMVISHVDAIKDEVDGFLEIVRNGADAQIKSS